ncbi:MarR family winged helix-turn-helix transcriptional regulator [Myroides sp. WP-1]|uniref:MarR family winged helix-turn-helix transcriptional regulator n=1 Tax=Myroides sp. WP-1 TaxID=2759944 RepID=UPI0015FA421F|nr:MarR family winged helix-turn-helix transcriptional regulator [Myroides sp. WP-1]MBB1140811.1 winged helix-turn-helix transcriptional regulator [Myroides sp. WP-1]
MNHKLLIDFMHLLFEFEKETSDELFSMYAPNITGFKQWVRDKQDQQEEKENQEELKVTIEQDIALSFFKLANYAKMYWRSHMMESPFFMHDNLIFLTNLWVHGEMTKMELIRKSTQEKPTGMQIINRLIELNFVLQKDSETDKRSKIVEITALGQLELVRNKPEIQQIAQVINGNLKTDEKKKLFQLLSNLNHFHEEVFSEAKSKEDLVFLIVNHQK